MIGVVLWSDPSDRKAVFWCEDQGDLAFFDACGPTMDGMPFFDAGDMVQFDVHMEHKLRRAHNPRLLQEHACQGLPDTLRRNTPDKAGVTAQHSAEIIRFDPAPHSTAETMCLRKA